MNSEATTFWEELYNSSDRRWSGNPNVTFAAEVADLTPGTALDLGCGEGADAIWLAQQGWRVTAIDISPTALARGARNAEAAGVSDLITWERHELPESFPTGVFDLVSAQFLHSPVDDVRDAAFHLASRSVAPGGLLLIVSHEHVPWAHGEHPHVALPTADEVLHSLDLAAHEWTIEKVGSVERHVTAPDGRPVVVTDSVVRARRLVTHDGAS